MLAHMGSQTLLSVTLPRDRTAPAAARHALQNAALPGSLETHTAAVLLVSELVSNAVLHGRGTEVTVEVAELAGRLRIEVQDDGDGFDPSAPRVERDDPGGWGLAVVDVMCSDWGVYAGSTHVWFELSL